MVRWHHRLNGHGLSKLQEIVKNREAGMLQYMGLQSWTQLNNNNKNIPTVKQLGLLQAEVLKKVK